MNSVIRGTEFSYRIDTEYGINHDGFIAEGTESIVFKGVKYGNDLKYSCALKFKPKTRLHDFMQREYPILESMQICRSVVRVLDVIEDLGDFSLPFGEGAITNQDFFCVVEEYIDGESLQDYCIKQWYHYDVAQRRWERNSTEHSYREVVKFQNQMIQFMINLCEIMKFVSNINEGNGKIQANMPIILHCDIKPENIMVTKHGKELVLIDFGRSQALTDRRTYQYFNNEDRTYTADYEQQQWQEAGKSNFYAYGTVGYAAPECYAFPSKGEYPFSSQIEAVTPGCVSVESDIFGFGSTFAECLSIYEICRDLFEKEPNSDDPRFFNHKIEENAESNVQKGAVEGYCDRDFRNIDSAFHEALENIIRKCTKTREAGFQKSEETEKEYYHNYYQLQADIERARDSIPPLDRKSDPLVRQMLGVSGFCAALGACFLGLWIIMIIFANMMARDRWKSLTESYTDNLKMTTFVRISEDMMRVPGKKTKRKNYQDILAFTYGGKPNDYVIDSDETEILLSLLKEYLPNQKDWPEVLDIIVQKAKNDNIDKIAKSVYRMNLASTFESPGYELAKALTQVNDTYEGDAETISKVYEIVLKYAEDNSYRKIISKLAIKLMSGGRTDTLANSLSVDRESIQNVLAPLTKIGGD